MTFNHVLLDEPELEFGDGGKCIDPRLGLLRFGPLQPAPGEKVSVGVIGTGETVGSALDAPLKSSIVASEKQPGFRLSRPRQRKPVP
jgi:hypothetical protein